MKITEAAGTLADNAKWLPAHNIKNGTWEQSDDDLFTQSAQASIVLAAYNDAEHWGILGQFSHLVSLDSHDNSSNQAFDEAVSAVVDLGDARHTTLWLGGGSPLAPARHNPVAYDRTYALGVVRGLAHGLDIQPRIEWSLRPESVIDVGLDCRLGELAIGRYQVA